MTPALAYPRVSGKGQVAGDGFPRQREAIHRYAKANGVEVVGEYRDEGVSGIKDLDGREGLSDLLARIRSNHVRVVLVERADRLARDLIVGELILNQFRDLGVKVIAADGGGDADGEGVDGADGVRDCQARGPVRRQGVWRERLASAACPSACRRM